MLLCYNMFVAAVAATGSDWLVNPPTTPVTLNSWARADAFTGFELTNTLITRRFAVGTGTWATVDFVSHVRGRLLHNTMLLCVFSTFAIISLSNEFPVTMYHHVNYRLLSSQSWTPSSSKTPGMFHCSEV